MPSHPLQRDLFGDERTPSWLADETVYSLAARYHRLSGHTSSKTTSRILFGHPRRGYQHDLPAGLSHLADVSQGMLGNPTEIATRHTVISYYLPFAKANAGEVAVDRMAGTQVSALKYSLGIIASGFRANHPLKFCSVCVASDQAQHGVAYWRRLHQMPTSLVCLAHDELLLVDRAKSDGLDRFEWLLPDVVRKRGSASVFRRSKQQMQLSRQVTHVTSSLTLLGPDFRFDSRRLRQTLCRRLDEFGWMTANGSLRRAIAARAYLHRCAKLASVSTLRGLPSSMPSTYRMLERILSKTKAPTHPARYVCVLVWLWDDWDSFWADYQTTQERSPIHEATKKGGEATVCAPSDESLPIVARLTEGESATSVARAFGLSVATVQRLAAVHGVPTSRRPKKLKHVASERLKELAVKGKDKHEIAKGVGVSPQSVMRYINTDLKLKAIWARERDVAARSRYRADWISVIQVSGSMGVGKTRALKPSVYAWLYRNDREWLKTINRARCIAAPRKAQSVDWASRDDELFEAISASLIPKGENIHELGATLGELCEMVPELRAKSRKIDRLPRTAALIEKLKMGVLVGSNE